MASFLDRLRMANIYGGSNPFTPTQDVNPMGIIDQLRRRFPQREGLDTIGQNMTQPLPPPNQRNKQMDVVYKPSISEQIGQERIAEQVHPDPNLEMQRALLEDKQKTEQIKLGQGQQKIDISQQRANAYALKASNPNMKFDFSGPTVKTADPTTGVVTDTGIPTGSLSDTDKLALTHENRLGEIGAGGEEARKTERIKGEEARKTKETIPGENPKPPKEQGQADLSKQYQNKYNVFINQHPEYRKFISLDPNSGMPIVDPVSKPDIWGPGFTQQQRDTAMNAIFGSSKGSAAPTKEQTDAEKAQALIDKYGKKPGGK